MTARWYYKVGDTEIGPISSGGLRQNVSGGTIEPDTLLRQGAEGNWIEARHVSGLFGPYDGAELSIPDQLSRSAAQRTGQSAPHDPGPATAADSKPPDSKPPDSKPPDSKPPDTKPSAPKPSAADLWYYRAGTAEIGPISTGGLRQKAFGGTVLPDTPVRNGPHGDWMKAEGVPGLFDSHTNPQPPAETESVSPLPATVADVPAADVPAADVPVARASIARHTTPDGALPDDSAPFDPYYTWLGIPADQQPPNHYRLLGIGPFEGNSEVIENAADRQMAHLRSRQIGTHSQLSQRLLNEVAAAKICLLTPDKKADYDRGLRQQAQQDAAVPGQSLGELLSRHRRPIAIVAAAAVVLATAVIFVAEYQSSLSAPARKNPVRRPLKTWPTRPLAPDATPPPPSQPPPSDPTPPPPSQPPSDPTPPPSDPTPPPSDPTPPPSDPTPPPSDPTPPPPDPTPPPSDPTPPPSDPALPPPSDPTSPRPAPAPSAAATETERLARMREIFQQQLPLLGQWQEKHREFKASEQQWLLTKGRWAGKIHQANIIRSQINELGLMTSGTEAGLGHRLSSNPQLAYLQKSLALLAAEAEQLEKDTLAAEKTAQLAKAAADRLRREVDLLAGPWFSLCDPFGKLPPEAHRDALETLCGWIAAEGGLSWPYMARGFALMHTGECEAAVEDFDRVADLDPGSGPLMTAAAGYALGRRPDTRKAAAAKFADAVRQLNRMRQDKTGRQDNIDRDLGMVYVFRGYSWLQQGQYARTMEEFRKAASPRRESPQAHQALARLYAACPHGTIRNGPKAVEHALKASAQSNLTAYRQAEEVRWQYADTLAAAYAESGDFARAVKWAQMALERAPARQRAAVARRVEMYRKGKPYRMQFRPIAAATAG